MDSFVLQTSDSDIQNGEVLGRLGFAANEADTGDARAISAVVLAMAESPFSSTSNATSLVFATAASGDAINRFSINSSGNFLPLASGEYDIGSVSFPLHKTFTDELRVADYNFPTVDGTAGHVLSTNGAGQLSFISAASAGDTNDYLDDVVWDDTTGDLTFSFTGSSNLSNIVENLDGRYNYIITNPVSGIGSSNYVARWLDASTLGTGILYDNGSNVGVGTSAPSSKLHIVGDVDIEDSYVSQLDFNATLYSNQARLRLLGHPYGFYSHFQMMGVDSSTELTFHTNNTERMRVTTAGNLGIGTTSPAFKLDVNGDFSADEINVNSQYTLPTGVGTAGQVIKYPSAGSQLVWADDDDADTNDYLSGVSWDNTTGDLTFSFTGSSSLSDIVENLDERYPVLGTLQSTPGTINSYRVPRFRKDANLVYLEDSILQVLSSQSTAGSVNILGNTSSALTFKVGSTNAAFDLFAYSDSQINNREVFTVNGGLTQYMTFAELLGNKPVSIGIFENDPEVSLDINADTRIQNGHSLFVGKDSNTAGFVLDADSPSRVGLWAFRHKNTYESLALDSSSNLSMNYIFGATVSNDTSTGLTLVGSDLIAGNNGAVLIGAGDKTGISTGWYREGYILLNNDKLDVRLESGAITLNEDANDVDFRVKSSVGDSIYALGSNGYVGINTVTPLYNLDVNGSFSANSINVNDQYTFPTGVGNVGDSLVYSGSNQVAWSGVSGGISSLSLNGLSDVSLNTPVADDSILRYDSTSQVWLNSAIDISLIERGSVPFGGYPSDRMGHYFYFDGSSEAVINTDGDDIDFRVEGNSTTHLLFVDAGNENIGINTNNPATKLHIREDSTYNSENTYAIKISDGNDPETHGLLLGVDSVNDGAFIEAVDPGSSWARNLLLQSLAGNVGIGELSPSEKLHVGGNILSDGSRPTTLSGGTAYATVKEANAGGWSFGHHAKGSSGTDRGGFGWFGTDDGLTRYYVGPSYTSLSSIMLTNAGNVGLKNLTPACRLTIGEDIPGVSNDGISVNMEGVNKPSFTTRRSTSNPVFSILPYTSQIYLSAGVYYNGAGWIHSSNDVHNCIFTLDPGAGVLWYAGNNGSSISNVASARVLWNTAGTWKSLLQTDDTGHNWALGSLSIGDNHQVNSSKLHLKQDYSTAGGTTSVNAQYVDIDTTSTQDLTNYTIAVHVDARKDVSTGKTDSGYIMGADFNAALDGTSTGTLEGSYGIRTFAGIRDAGTVNNAYGVYSRVLNLGTGTVNNGYGVYIHNVNATNSYGLYQSATDDKNYFAGDVGIGTTTPATKLDVNGVITATGGNSTDWNEAHGWGNHASAGYITSVTSAWTDSSSTLVIGSNVHFLYDGKLTIPSSYAELVVNEGQTDFDFRVEGAGDTHLLFTDAGNDRVGIGTSSPSTALEVNGVITATGGNSTDWNEAHGWGDHASAGYLDSSDIIDEDSMASNSNTKVPTQQSVKAYVDTESVRPSYIMSIIFG